MRFNWKNHTVVEYFDGINYYYKVYDIDGVYKGSTTDPYMLIQELCEK